MGQRREAQPHAPGEQRTRRGPSRREEKAGRGRKNCFHRRKALRESLKTPLCARAQGTPSFAGPSHKLGPLALNMARTPPAKTGSFHASENRRGQAAGQTRTQKAGPEARRSTGPCQRAQNERGAVLTGPRPGSKEREKVTTGPAWASHQRRYAAFLTACPRGRCH